MNKTYKRNLSGGFGLSLLILLLSSIASYISIDSLLTSSRQVSNTPAFIKELDNIISTLVDAETGERGFLLTSEPEFLDPYHGASQKATTAMEKIKRFIIDIPDQQKNYDRLEILINERLHILQNLIDKKRTGKAITLADLKNGKDHMDEVRRLVAIMETNAQNALIKRTELLNTFATYTRLIIVVASLLALLITIIFYLKVKKDFIEKVKLQDEMVEKDRSIGERIKVIEEIANKVSLGNYQIRINTEDKGTLGSLADSLNTMAESLEHSFGLLSDKEWLQTGGSELNENMMGGFDLKKLCENVVNYMAAYTNSQIGTIYIAEDEGHLKLYSSYGISIGSSKKFLHLGEGLTGQCAADGKIHILENVQENSILINYAAGSLKPKNIIAFPLCNEGIIKGVIELAKITAYSNRELALFDLVSQRIASIINRVQNRVKMQELLEETQAQTEELQSQHAELQNLNAELEANSQKIQSSEEELRVQQDELLIANKKLKQRTVTLEEKNQMIEERNIEIQRKVEELFLSTKYKSEFLANMSHELRTPLNSILLLSGLMVTNTEKNLSEEYIDYAKVIQSSGNGLLLLIDEILDLSKVESGKMQMDFEHITIKEVVHDMELLFNPFAREKEIELSFHLHPDVPATMQTDKMRLEQVLKNLLSNALKFTPIKGTIQFSIFMAPKDPMLIAFSIKDNGIGIAPEKQGLVFEAFQQEDGSTKRKYGGTGLGLSISRELVRLLNGKIDLRSEVGKGSEFIAYIPLVQPGDNQEAIEQTPVTAGKSSLNQESERQPLKGFSTPAAASVENNIDDDRMDITAGDKLLLIIEDDNNLAKILLDFTRTNGYKGMVASRGDEGLALAKRFKPTGILLDIHLPVKNGWEIMETLKNDRDTKHIPVHIMSSNKFRNESLQKGADDFINKPIAFEKIKSIFEKLNDPAIKQHKKILIVEEDEKHAVALAYFLTTSKINTKIQHNMAAGIDSLLKEDLDCVILDRIGTEDNAYERLEELRKTSGLETLPIIFLTSKNLSKKEEQKLKKYAHAILIKTAPSYKHILDEISLFLHAVNLEKAPTMPDEQFVKLGFLNEVLQGKTILVADDDVRNIFSLTKALEIFKITVITAMDGKEALNKLEENPGIDIVLMDMMMPEMDGYDAAMQIKKNPKLQNIPVIAVTAKAMTGDREKCIEAGASDYITKPVDVDQLLSLLRVWMYEKQFHNN